MRALLTLCTFISVILLPWPLTTFLAVVSAFLEPFVPLAAGIFADTLYYTPQAGIPLFTICGALLTISAFFVRSRLSTSSMRK